MRFIYYFIPMLLVLIVPVVFILQGYTWNIGELGKYHDLYYLTITGGSFLAILISIVLTLILMFFYRKNLALSISIGLYCVIAVVGTNVIKTVIKEHVQEPRPFVYQMANIIVKTSGKSYYSDMQLAYNLSSDPQAIDKSLKAIASGSVLPLAVPPQPTTTDSNGNVIKDKFNPNFPFLCDDCSSPEVVTNLYARLDTKQQEFFTQYFISKKIADKTLTQKADLLRLVATANGYSLPSGHAMLGTVWVMIFFILAFNAGIWQLWLITLGVTAWGLGLGVSRILLGYHYAHDVLFSAVIGSFFVWVTFWLIFIFYKIFYKILGNRVYMFNRLGINPPPVTTASMSGSSTSPSTRGTATNTAGTTGTDVIPVSPVIDHTTKTSVQQPHVAPITTATVDQQANYFLQQASQTAKPTTDELDKFSFK